MRSKIYADDIPSTQTSEVCLRPLQSLRGGQEREREGRQAVREGEETGREVGREGRQ